MSRYRLWKLRRRLRARANALAENWVEHVVAGTQEDFAQVIYETLCRDHAVTP